MLDPESLGEKASGKLVRATGGAWAFVPRPLPPHLDIDRRLLRITEDAARELGNLAGTGRGLANPYLLIQPFVSREAVLSSKIEGSQATLSDLFLSEATPSASSAETREVSNYVAALGHGLDRAKKRPVGLNLILEIHEILMRETQGASAGRFRQRQNWIGPPGSRIGEASYVPPPVAEMHAALDALEKFIHAESDLPLLVRLAAIHYQFEAIHPFIDGNGRVGRLLISLLLCTEGVLPHPLLYLSEYFESHRRQYYELLLAVSKEGAWNDWLNFFLAGVAGQARDASARAGQLQDLRARLHQKFHTARSPAFLLKLIDELFVSPFITYGRARRILDSSPRGAALNVVKLVDAGILKQVPNTSHPTVFVAKQILDAISTPAREVD
jgi:cell filamentation protein, protein adenylyltransferase